ncbi:MAG: hypothetical protein UT43_C0017G0010 [Parcubacteria group bacterium GW2011_GWC1_39_29]|uniref:Uncharacterized protein n=1 Tax=Candidatus Yanofskybacteria bacterium GW2011_GWD1_39_16 TaxID=1619030 RepID=A0A837HTC1_9BACT|nr:MAG: hypothetical protein UT35_C0002G0009 [Candidatus Yanofskybacteria bacterium GW2011_GWD1_39_16]KKR14739.1 MAG: hypothetical protein UT43_C0017G0010 [Parcubacteria group bacterium GW2011_GWC1_39_29]
MKTRQQIKDEVVKEFVENGANLEHDRWARWQKYVHSLCVKNSDGSLTIPKERVEHWEKEIITPYSELTELVKEMDRKETRNYLPFLLSSINKAVKTKHYCRETGAQLKHCPECGRK